MREGLIAGSIAAVIAALVSLPLRSPHDTFFNSASVVIGVLIVGIVAGAIWGRLASARNGRLYFALMLVGGLAAVAGAAAGADSQLDRALSYSVPLAAIAFVLAGILVPTLSRTSVPRMWWSAPAAVVVALALGFGLVGQGDQASGELSLPPRAANGSTTTVAPTAAPVNPARSVADAELTGAASSSPEDLDGQLDDMTYVVGEGSEATFTVEEQLARLPLPNDAVMRTNALSGEINLDGRPSVIEIDIHQLSSDQAFRDRYVRGRMFPGSPIATFTVDDVGQLPDGFFAAETVTSQTAGILTIRGIEVPLTFDLEIRNDGDILFILGRTRFTWDDIQMPAPTAGPVVSVEDEVRVEVLLVATPRVPDG